MKWKEKKYLIVNHRNTIDRKMKLTDNFTLEEFVISQTAIRNGIRNNPSKFARNNLKALCINVLQPLRDFLIRPVIITSGFRSETLNSIIGGSQNSQHIMGEAADIIIPRMQACDLFAFILKSELEFDQLILEFNRWVHISYSRNYNRHRALLAKRVNGKVVYEKVFNTN